MNLGRHCRDTESKGSGHPILRQDPVMNLSMIEPTTILAAR